MSNTKMSAKSYLLVSDMKWSGQSILWWCNFETLSAKLTGLSDGLSPNCFTLSNPTQIATFEAIPLSGINCQLLANGSKIHFHKLPPKYIFTRPHLNFHSVELIRSMEILSHRY